MSDTKSPRTPEETNKARKELYAYYNHQCDLLRRQKEYEYLLADIEDAKCRRMMSIIKMAQMTAVPKENAASNPKDKNVNVA